VPPYLESVLLLVTADTTPEMKLSLQLNIVLKFWDPKRSSGCSVVVWFYCSCLVVVATLPGMFCLKQRLYRPRSNLSGANT